MLDVQHGSDGTEKRPASLLVVERCLAGFFHLYEADRRWGRAVYSRGGSVSQKHSNKA